MKNIITLIIQIFASILISGCLIIPTPEHSNPWPYPGIIESAIPENEIKKLEPEKTEREDILLKFGDPTFRLKDDHIFMYCWQRYSGYVIWLDFTTGAWIRTHLLGLEFSDDNKLSRFAYFHFTYDYDKQKGVRQCENILDWGEPALIEWLPPNS